MVEIFSVKLFNNHTHRASPVVLYLGWALSVVCRSLGALANFERKTSNGYGLRKHCNGFNILCKKLLNIPKIMARDVSPGWPKNEMWSAFCINLGYEQKTLSWEPDRGRCGNFWIIFCGWIVRVWTCRDYVLRTSKDDYGIIHLQDAREI